MNLDYPPLSPDDTQPTSPLRLSPRRGKRRAWWLVLVAALLGFAALIVIGGALLLAVLLGERPQAVAFTVVDGGQSVHQETYATTVADALRELGVVLAEGDSVSPAPANPITADVVIEIKRARAVTLVIDGQSQSVRTLFENPLDILKSSGVALNEDDLIYVDGSRTDAANLILWPVPASSITIKRAVSLDIDDNGQKSNVRTTASTVGEALFQAGITLYLGDVVTPDLNTAPDNGLLVTIDRSHPVTIVADGVSIETRTRGTTVGAALAEAGLTLVGLDYAIPGEDAPILPGVTIRVIRTTEEVVSDQSLIPFETVYQADAALELDQRSVIHEGQNGVQETTYRVRYENGVEVSREVESSAQVRAPVNRSVAYGTQIVLRTVETADGPHEYWRKFRMIATSYHPAALGGDNVTATGRILTKGIVGIDPGIISYGTQVFVPGYGVGVAADTGGPRTHRYWIDLGYDDDNYVSWSRWVDVYLLTPVPERIEYLLPEPPR